jgi:glycosyltransferase domain-containing protein
VSGQTGPPRRCGDDVLIDDPKAFAVVIPTYEGTPFLRRTLEYLRHVSFMGEILIADDSSGGDREFALSSADRYPELSIQVHDHPHRTRFLDKLVRSLAKSDAKYVLLCGQDDFLVPDAVENLLRLLEERPDCSAARGKVARFRLARQTREDGSAKGKVEFSRHAMLAYEEGSAAERVLSHIRAYTSTLYSVHRREHLIESFRTTEASTKNVIFFQYLSSCITASLGKIAATDDLFMIRQAHARSWAASLVNDYEHWPLLLASPDYSRFYGEFRQAILGLLHAGDAAEGKRLGEEIDRAFVELVRVSCFRENLPSAAEDAFQSRLAQPGTAERETVDSVLKFAFAYPDTC